MVSDVIGYLDYKDKELFAVFSVYCDRCDDLSKVQDAIDELSEKWADACIEKYSQLLSLQSIRDTIFNHIKEIGANQKYSGKRFSHTFYNKLLDYQMKIRSTAAVNKK